MIIELCVITMHNVVTLHDKVGGYSKIELGVSSSKYTIFIIMLVTNVENNSPTIFYQSAKVLSK